MATGTRGDRIAPKDRMAMEDRTAAEGRRAMKDRRTVFAWGRISAGLRTVGSGEVEGARSGRRDPGRADRFPGSKVPQRRGAFGRYPRSEQLSIFPALIDRTPVLRELRLPAGGAAPMPGPWTLSAMVSGSKRA